MDPDPIMQPYQPQDSGSPSWMEEIDYCRWKKQPILGGNIT